MEFFCTVSLEETETFSIEVCLLFNSQPVRYKTLAVVSEHLQSQVSLRLGGAIFAVLAFSLRRRGRQSTTSFDLMEDHVAARAQSTLTVFGGRIWRAGRRPGAVAALSVPSLSNQLIGEHPPGLVSSPGVHQIWLVHQVW